jgi:hypothetical protein
MDKEEMQVLLAEVYGREFPDQSEALKHQLYPTDVSMVDLATFENFARINRSVLFPIFKLQESLQDGIAGRDFWEKQAHKRYVDKLVDMDVYEKLFEEIKHGQQPLMKIKGKYVNGKQSNQAEAVAVTKHDVTDYGIKQKPKSLREMFVLPKLIPDEVFEDLRKVKEDRKKKNSSSKGHKGSSIGNQGKQGNQLYSS